LDTGLAGFVPGCLMPQKPPESIAPQGKQPHSRR
jgi:hypothetical protein